MKPKKELGQNFLTSSKAVEALVDASGPKVSDVYLEIGPGHGVVTRTLAIKVKKVIAVELDRSLVPSLKKNLKDFPNVEIVNGDALKILNNHISVYDYEFNKIIGSIPYQITSPLLHLTVNLSQEISLDAITLLIQKEVAQRLSAEVPHANYLSIFVQTYFDAKYVKTVPRGAFAPVPKVDGAIVVLRPKPVGLNGKKAEVEPEIWANFLHTAFKFPRKMLRKVFDEKMLESAGIKPSQRPQEVELSQWQKLFKIYEKNHI